MNKQRLFGEWKWQSDKRSENLVFFVEIANHEKMTIKKRYFHDMSQESVIAILSAELFSAFCQRRARRPTVRRVVLYKTPFNMVLTLLTVMKIPRIFGADEVVVLIWNLEYICLKHRIITPTISAKLLELKSNVWCCMYETIKIYNLRYTQITLDAEKTSVKCIL